MKFRHYNNLIEPALLLVFVLRFAEISFLAERGTSHYLSGDRVHLIFWAVYFIVSVFFASSFFFLPKKGSWIRYLKKVSANMHIFILPALLYFCDFLVGVISLFSAENIGALKILSLIFEGLSAVGFLFFAIYPDTVKFKNILTKIVTAAIPISFVLRLFEINTQNFGYISKPFDTFEIFKTAFLALATAALSYMTASKVSRRKFSVTVFLSAIFATIRLSDVLYAILNNTTADASVDCLKQIADVFCVIALITVNRAIYKRPGAGKRRKI